jgi:RNA polymerase sigma-70 factor (ECF subfamily)
MDQVSQQIAIRDVAVERRNEDAACEDAFAALVCRQSRFAFRIAYAILRNTQDAEDAVQETFLRLHRSRACEKMIDEKAFIARVVWRIAVDRRRKTSVNGTAQDPPALTNNPEQAAIATDRSQTLHRMIDALPGDLRQPLVLAALDELTSQQIAAILEIPEGTVRSRQARARQILRQKLSAIGRHS